MRSTGHHAGVLRRALDHHQAVIVLFDPFRAEAHDELEAPVVHEVPQIVTELATRGQPVGAAAAEDTRKIRGANRPDDVRSQVVFGELREIEQDVRGRMPAPDDEHALVLVDGPIAPENIRHPIRDAIRERDLAGCGRARGRSRVVTGPGSRSVDHRAREVDARLPARLVDRDREGMVGAVLAHDLVDAVACDVVDARAGFDDHAHRRRCGERREIGRIQFISGRQRICRRRLPAVRAQDGGCRRIDVEAPRREHAHMPPVADVSSDGVAGFVELHRHAAREEVRGGREADRAGADDGNGQVCN
jgi:hypothetical protein